VAIVLVASATAIGLFAFGGDATTPSASPAPVRPAGTVQGASCSASPYLDNPQLGPASLPDQGLVGAELLGYDRTGGIDPQIFLDEFYSTASGWDYPDNDGFQLTAANAVNEWQQDLPVGQFVDRYGSPDKGRFLAPTGLSYSSRSIPPANLVADQAETCNYHNYRVLKTFKVNAGPIAGGFGQPGGGLQYQLDASLIPDAPATPAGGDPKKTIDVSWLLANGYLAEVDAA
jgi:hypothetical protein